MERTFPNLPRNLLLLLTTWLLIGAIVEFYHIGWGTGVWLGQFAPTWFVAFLIFILLCILLLVLLVAILWRPERFEKLCATLASFRDRLGVFSWLIAAALLFAPVYFLQFSFWGLVLHGPYVRVLLVLLIGIVNAWLLTRLSGRFVDWPALIVSFIMISGTLSFFAPLVRVTSYPFSLGWSEGNRLWDYSVLFGRDRYLYPADKDIPVFLETNRQLIGAIPFLIPGLKIEYARLWLVLVDIIPYLVLGWIVFHVRGTRPLLWLLAGVWVFTFVRQGPIHAPLLLCAIIVALAWGRSLWLAVLLVFVAGYFAQATRSTWLFAPAMWSVMLEFAGAPELNKYVWRRSIFVGIAGLLGGYFAPSYLPGIINWIISKAQLTSAVGLGNGSGDSVSQVQSILSTQALLWDRLLPNSTYGPGILLGLAVAVVPLIIVLVHLATTGRWKLNAWQKASLILPLLAFLAVGLIVSVKIGGGGDLHNLDMFLIGLLFAAAIAWRNGAYEWIRAGRSTPAWVAGSLIAMLLLPAYQPLRAMRPLSVDADPRLVVTLADIMPNDPLPDPLPDTIPSDADTQQALKKLRDAVQSASSSGDILFMDQRQLLTFGYIEEVSLVPEYDKKLLIDMAMSDNAAYFETFYNDLASHRFSLIITNPVNQRLDREEGHFGEENNAWVKWVTRPLLCYYQPLDVLKKVDVELLVPQTGAVNCEDALP